MSLTPRVLGLADAGFDPLSISHILGITFAQVNEALRGVEVAEPASGGTALNVVSIGAEAYDAANGDFVIASGFTSPHANVEGKAGSPILKCADAIFAANMVGCPVKFEEEVPPGTTILSYQSAHEVTLSADVTEDEETGNLSIGAVVVLPTPTAGRAVTVKRLLENLAEQDGLVLVKAASGQVGGRAAFPLLGHGAAAAFVADGTDWTLQADTFGDGPVSEAEGVARGSASHAEGTGETLSTGNNAHAEGQGTKATSAASHAEGSGSEAGYVSHAEGLNTKALGSYAHAEGDGTDAAGDWSHAAGLSTRSTAQGGYAGGVYAHAFAPWYWTLSSGVNDRENPNSRSQYSFWMPFGKTTDATPTLLGVGINAPPEVTDLTIPTLTTALVEARVVARDSDGHLASAWDLAVLVDDVKGEGFRFVGGVKKSVVAQDAGAAAWDVDMAVSTDEAGGHLTVTVTGEAGHTILWHCTLKLYEIAGG